MVFVLLLPFGVLALRLSSFIPVRLHYLIQGTALLFALAGLALAIAYSELGYGGEFSEYHQIIGIIVVVLLVSQAVGGILHHVSYKDKMSNAVPGTRKPGRTPLAHAHIWLGRIGILLGMINAVLGFVLAGSKTGAIAIGVVSLLICLGVALVVVIVDRRKSSQSQGEKGPMLRRTQTESDGSSPDRRNRMWT